jgi:hypothetical protein
MLRDNPAGSSQQCLEYPRPAGAKLSLTEDVTSPFQAEPTHDDFPQPRFWPAKSTYPVTTNQEFARLDLPRSDFWGAGSHLSGYGSVSQGSVVMGQNVGPLVVGATSGIAGLAILFVRS